MRPLAASLAGRSLATFLIGVRRLGLALVLASPMLLSGACSPAAPPPPWAGVPDHAKPGFVPVPGGRVNTSGGNLVVERTDISLDTILGTYEIRAVYNAATGSWLWSFQTTYDGASFLDPTGYVVSDVSPESTALGPDGTIAGSSWVRVDETTLKTKGGLAHHFGSGAALSHISLSTRPYPRLQFTGTTISQCAQAGVCLPLFQVERTAGGDPTRITDVRSGRVAEFDYDAAGRLVVARSPVDVEGGMPGIRYEYATGGTLLTAITNAEGERIEYVYDPDRRLSTVTRVGEGNPRHRFEFHGLDPVTGRRETIHTNPLEGRTRYAHDALGRLREVELEATGEVVSLTYADSSAEAALRPASLVAPDGSTTSFSVSAGGDITQIVTPAGNVRSFTYAPAAVNPTDPWARAPLRVEDSLGLLSEWTYGPDGRPVRIDLPEGEFVELDYAGPVLASLRRSGEVDVQFNAYGTHGHWVDATASAFTYPLRRAFDPVGNLVAASGVQEGGVLGRGHDANRLVSAIHVARAASGRVVDEEAVTLERRSDGDPLAIRRPQGGDHEFVHDALGRLVILRERVDGASHDTHFEYDLAGNRTARERPNGMREEWEYDVYGRTVRYAALRGGVLEGEALITYEDGRPVSYFDSTRQVTELYTYDDAGRLERITYSTGEWVQWSRDRRDRVRSQVFATFQGAPRTLSFEYDGADRQVRAVLDGAELLAEYAYQDGRQVRVTYGNGLVREALYDPETGRIAGFETTSPSAGIVEDTTIERANLPDPSRFVLSTSTTTALGRTTERFSLNPAGGLTDPDRRVGARVWAWEDDAGAAREYAYDGLSNLVSNASGDTFAYNAEGSRLLSADLAQQGGTIAFTYDAAGYVTSRNGEDVEWTATGRLRAFGGMSLAWDMTGRLISMSGNGSSRDFGLFGGAVERDPATGGLGAIDLGLVWVSLVDGTRRYRHQDFRGNTRFTSDEGGAVVSHRHYSAYGLEVALGPEGDAGGFAGGTSLGSGILLLGARVYDSRIGRFWSPDPVFQALNQYSYTLGDPVNFWDPGGEAAAEAKPSAADVAAAFARAGIDITEGAVAAVLAGIGTRIGGPSTGTALSIQASVALADAVNSTAIAFRLLLEATTPPPAPPIPPDVIPPVDPPPVPPTCAPSRVQARPVTGAALLGLVALQIGLAVAVLGRWQRRRCGTGHPARRERSLRP